MGRETIGIVQYMTNKGAWENVPLYRKDNELVDFWLGRGDFYDCLQDYCYNIELGDAAILNYALGFYENNEVNDCPDWKAVHLATLKYLATQKPDYTELYIKVKTVAELAEIYLSMDQIRLVYYLDY